MINEFFANPRDFHSPARIDGHTTTIQDFYDQCIAPVLSDKCMEAACGWHRMLVDYLARPEAVLPIRLWENIGRGTASDGIGNGSRRRAFTICPDGFRYAFASNSFARAIYSMVLSGFCPSVEEFSEMMRTFQMRIGFHWGNVSVDETIIAAYPISYPRKFYLDGWYLAHIHGPGDEPYCGYEDIDIGQVFPVGTVNDWHREQIDGNEVQVRRLNVNLDDRMKEVARAHCLRFADPLNYFLVPSCERHNPQTNRRIGEEACLRDYVDCRMRERICSRVYNEFRNFALVARSASSDIRTLGQHAIDVRFGSFPRGGQSRENMHLGMTRHSPVHGNGFEVVYGGRNVRLSTMVDTTQWVVQQYVLDHPEVGVEAIRAQFRPRRMFKGLANAQQEANWQRQYPRAPIACANNEQLVVNRNWNNRPNDSWPQFVASAREQGFDIREA